jgi:hypothetical protein
VHTIAGPLPNYTQRGNHGGWCLQTPDDASPTLLKNILASCEPAQKGGAAFAFASAQGVKMLGSESVFSKFLEAADFTIVVGLDAITDTKAVDELRKLSKKHPNFKPKLFLHSAAGSIFHPKTIWLKTPKGGVIITGSGNLTAGGLKMNWEAMAVEVLTTAEIAEAEKSWESWLKAHKEELHELDDPKATDKAKANTVVRAKIKKALKKPTAIEAAGEEEVEAAEELLEEIEHEFSLNPVLIAEVPKSGDRWQQVNFDLRSYQEYFGVTKGVTKHLRFYQVHKDGTLGALEDRQAVAVKSQNYRFEIGAAHGLLYPTKGNPILVFEKTAEDTFNYVLLMPTDTAHESIQKYLDENYERTKKKLRVQITAGDLEKVWPDAPFFL